METPHVTELALKLKLDQLVMTSLECAKGGGRTVYAYMFASIERWKVYYTNLFAGGRQQMG